MRNDTSKKVGLIAAMSGMVELPMVSGIKKQKQKQPSHIAESRKAAADAKRLRKAKKRRDDDVWSRKSNPCNRSFSE